MKTEEADGGMGVLSAPNEPKDLSLATAIWSRHVAARFFTITNEIRFHWFHFLFLIHLSSPLLRGMREGRM